MPGYGPAFVKGFEANVVSHEENVAAVVTKVALNEADAGLAYASDAAGSNGPRIALVVIPRELEQHAEYLAAVTARAKDRQLAARFVEFLRSKDAGALLVDRGFSLPGAEPP